MRTLWLAPYYPLPIRSGGHSRLANLVRHLGNRHALYWLAPTPNNPSSSIPTLEGLAAPPELVPVFYSQTLWDRIANTLWPANWRQSGRRTFLRLAGYPSDAVRMFFSDLETRLAQILRQGRFDIVQLEYTGMGVYWRVLRRLAPEIPLVLDELDISYVALQRLAEADPARRTALAPQIPRMIRFEQQLWKECHAILTMSEVDRLRVGQSVPLSKVASIPNGVDPEFFDFRPRTHNGERILFLGNLSHPPNIVGLRFLLDQIWPKLRQSRPGVRLDVVGAEAEPALVDRMNQTGVDYHGYVSDVRRLLQRAGLMVVPIFNGSGTRLKVLEAFAAGLPVVSTSMGCEGLEVVEGKHVRLAESPRQFVEAIVGLLNRPEEGRRLAHKARLLVMNRYDWKTIAGQLEQVWIGLRERKFGQSQV